MEEEVGAFSPHAQLDDDEREATQWAHLSKHQQRRRAKRRRDRELARSEKAATGCPPLKRVSLTRKSQSVSNALEARLDHEKLPIASSGWVGKMGGGGEGTVSLQELLGPQYAMTYVDWDGRCVFKPSPKLHH